jgi:hypothetical protein
MGLMAGIAGRAYNVSGIGLNQYIVLLAGTGTGKEGMASGIDRLISASRETTPMADLFLGPAIFASGQALLKILPERPCFVSILGEIGLTLQQICSPRANNAEKMLLKVLLEIYNKSGRTDLLKSMNYSDATKNTLPVYGPNVTILGESTPGAFFDGLGVQHIMEGLIPRFSILEYRGKRPPRNKQAFMSPHPHLVEKINALMFSSMSIQQNNQTANVLFSADAERKMDEFDKAVDDKINNSEDEIEKELWSRAHVKAMKLAALLAIGHNIHDPVINKIDAEWGINFATADIQAIEKRFKIGEVGTGYDKREYEVIRAIKQYAKMHKKSRQGYSVSANLAKHSGVVPYTYLKRRVTRLAAFKNDRRGEVVALREVLDAMIDSGIIVQLSPQQVRKKYGSGAKCYARAENWS